MKILIIEDEKEIIKFLKNALEKEMFIVDSAEDGERGSFMARTSAYNLIVLDYLLPKMNGAEVLKEIRDDGLKIPILMLTVKGEIENKKELFNIGADDYLSKPFLLEELILRIKALLKRPLFISQTKLSIGDFSLNQDTKTICYKNKEIYFTRKEYCLFEYFLKNKEKIISRSELLENIWDYNADPFSNSLETHIASLRKKLKTNKNRNLLHTFSGRGYKLSLRKLN